MKSSRTRKEERVWMRVLLQLSQGKKFDQFIPTIKKKQDKDKKET